MITFPQKTPYEICEISSGCFREEDVKILRDFIHVDSQGARVDESGDKVLIVTKMFYCFDYTLLVSAIRL